MWSEGSATKDEPTSMEYPDALETDDRPSAVQGCYTSYLGIHDEAYYVLVWPFPLCITLFLSLVFYKTSFKIQTLNYTKHYNFDISHFHSWSVSIHSNMISLDNGYWGHVKARWWDIIFPTRLARLHNFEFYWLKKLGHKMKYWLKIHSDWPVITARSRCWCDANTSSSDFWCGYCFSSILLMSWAGLYFVTA